MKTRVIIAFSNMLFADGVARLLEGDKEISIIKALEPGEEYSMDTVKSLGPDLVITDFTTLFNSFPDLDASPHKVPFVLVDTNCGKENIVSAILNKKVSGVLLSNTDAALLKKAIKAVSRGDIWIDKATVKNLLHGINAIGKDKTAVLSDREREITVLIGQGYRNKEIAQRLNISEPTVKTHLHRIFQKLNIKTRSELITYAIKSNEMNPSPVGRSGSAEAL